MRTLNLEQAAELLKVSPRSLADKRYRAKLPLPARKVGRKIIFLEADIARLLDRNIERLVAQR
jgi:hypothetical protein